MKNTNTDRIVFIAIALVLAVLAASVLYQNDRLRDRLSTAERNLVAVTDTVHELELKNGRLISYAQALTVDKNTLKDELSKSELSKREIEKSLNSKIDRLVKTIAEFKSDTIVVTDTVEVLGESLFAAPFEYTDRYTDLYGKTLFRIDDLSSETTIERLSVRVPITVGMTDNYQVFVHSENPNTSIELAESLVLDPKKYNQKRLGIGLYAGFGMQYGLISKTIDLGPQAGVGVYWRLK